MKKRLFERSVLCFLALALAFVSSAAATSQPNPDGALALLKAGNARFVAGTSEHPHTDSKRLAQAGRENQGDHAYATVITCSDSRVPVERIFDAGVMDLFIIRVAGNVCDTDEVGSIEYGLAHVNTPVLVVLGHTQCGAVTAVTHAVHGTGHALERNIPPLVDNIQPAVERAMAKHPDVHGDEIIPHAIVENVWQGIEDLFMRSPSTRELVESGKAKVVGAIYDVGTGNIRWLPESRTEQILAKVASNPNRALNAMAPSGQGTEGSHDSHAGTDSHGSPATGHAVSSESDAVGGHAAATNHGNGHGNGTQHTAAQVQVQHITLIEPARLKTLDDARHRQVNVNYAGASVESNGMSMLWKLAGIALTVLVVLGIIWQAGVFQKMGIAGKLYSGFGAMILIAVTIGVAGYYALAEVNAEAHVEAAALDLDITAVEMASNMKDFLLYGIEDRARGEASVKKVNELIAQSKQDIEAIRTLHLRDAEKTILRDIEEPVDEFSTVFAEVANKFHEIEEYKEQLDALGGKAAQALEEALHRYESKLEQLETEGRRHRRNRDSHRACQVAG